MMHRRIWIIFRPATVIYLGLAACIAWAEQHQPTSGDASPLEADVDVPVMPGPGGVTAAPEGANPFEGDQQAIQDGMRLYNWYNCVGCHAPNGGGGMGPPLSDKQWIYGDDPVSIYASIWEGRPEGMPAWAGKIPPDEVWKLVAYLQSLPGEEPSFAPQELYPLEMR